MTKKVFLQQPKRRKSLGAKSGQCDMFKTLPSEQLQQGYCQLACVGSYTVKQKQNTLEEDSLSLSAYSLP
jgi:hypothetical protein